MNNFRVPWTHNEIFKNIYLCLQVHSRSSVQTLNLFLLNLYQKLGQNYIFQKQCK